MTIDALKMEALKLEMLQRIDFISFLVESISKEERDREENFTLSENLQKEIEKRQNSVKNGTVQTVSFTEVEAKIRAQHGF
jgi:Putative addiction module component